MKAIYFEKLRPILAVILMICGILAAIQGAVASNFERLSIPVPACVLAESSRTSEELLTTVVARLNQRFRGPCRKLSLPIESPFIDRAQTLIRQEAPTALFAFWIDGNSNTLLIRGFDLSLSAQSQTSGLVEWASAKIPIASLSEDALRSTVNSKIDSIIDRYPAVGILETGGFYIWSPKLSLNVELSRRGAVHLHPRLPLLSTFDWTREENIEGKITQDTEGGSQIHWSKMPTEIIGTNRLWIRERAGSKSK